MITTQGPSGADYHHNSDYSGPVIWFDEVRMSMPFEDMKALVLDYFRSKWVSVLEQADDDVLERLLINLPKEK